MRKNTFKHSWLLLSLLLFFILSWFVTYTLHKEGLDWHKKPVNEGQLINPPRPWHNFTLLDENGDPIMLEQSFGQWTLVYVVPQDCSAACKKLIFSIQQTHDTMSENGDRIRLAVLSFTRHKNAEFNTFMNREYPQFIHFFLPLAEWNKVMAGLPSNSLATTVGYIYVVDPRGNIRMGYPSTANPSRIFKNLQKIVTAQSTE